MLTEQAINHNEVFMNVQDVKVYYERHAHPKPKESLFFVHGFLSSTYSFRHVIPLLKGEHENIAIDLPGFGKSEKSLKFHYSYENYARLIIEVIQKLGLQKVILVGHSMGGQIVLHVAKQAPELVKKLFLISSSGYLRRARRAAIYLSYTPYFSWFVKQWFKTKDIYKNIYDGLIDKSIINDDLINGYSKPFEDNNFIDSMVRLLRHREGDLSSKELKQIATPSVLIWGKEDNSVPLSIGERLNNDLPNSKLVIVNGTGHMICDEKPKDLYNEMIKNI